MAETSPRPLPGHREGLKAVLFSTYAEGLGLLEISQMAPFSFILLGLPLLLGTRMGHPLSQGPRGTVWDLPGISRFLTQEG